MNMIDWNSTNEWTKLTEVEWVNGYDSPKLNELMRMTNWNWMNELIKLTGIE